MKRLIGFWCLIASLLVIASTAAAQERMADQILRCAAGLHLPGYIEKWNTLPFDIPALKPGESHRIQRFGASEFPKKTGNNYGITITADPLKTIAESNETNHYARLDTAPEYATKNIEKGKLQVTVLMNGEPIKAVIRLSKPGQATYDMPPVQRQRWMKQTPFEESWPVCKYDLHIHSEASSPIDIYVISKAIPIEIKKDQRLEKTITIPAGRLQLDVTVEGKKTSGIKVRMNGVNHNFQSFSSYGVLEAPVDVTVPAGTYELRAKNTEEKQTQTADVEIKADSVIKKALNFDQLRVGYLKLNLLMAGKPIPFEFGWTQPARGFYAEGYLFSSATEEPAKPLEGGRYGQSAQLRVGVYDLKVHELAAGGQDIVVKNIAIHEGETVEKTVEIHQPGTLIIRGKWTHQPFNLIACAEYHNPLNPQRLGGLMGGNGGRSRGDCLNPNAHLTASISSPGRSDGNVVKETVLNWIADKDNDDDSANAIGIAAGVYDVVTWPVGHRELAQTLKGIEVAASGTTRRKLEFRWPGKD